jgi:hypothetical protein
VSQETSVILQQCRFEFASKTPFRAVDVVLQQFQFFKEMIASSTPASPAPYPQTIFLLAEHSDHMKQSENTDQPQASAIKIQISAQIASLAGL